MKKNVSLFLLLFLLGASAPAFADHGKGGECKTCQAAGKCEKCGGEAEGSHQCPITEKILKKAHFLLDNAEEIGLSDEQTAQVKAIKMQTKKEAIKEQADMEIFMLDLKAKLGEDKFDVEGTTAMVDQATAGMSSGAKAKIEAYAKLKAVLSEEQLVKAKAIWKKK
jgi:hypothetical protein